MIAIATATILETVRRRVVAIASIASLAIALAIGWGFRRLAEAIPQPQSAIGIEAVLTIFVAFAFSILLALGASFMAAPAIAGELENGTALAILTRPLSRSAYVAGKWLGLVTIVVAYALVFGALAFVAIAVGSGYRAPQEVTAIGFLIAQSIVLLTLTTALSTRLAPLASSIIAVVAFGISWVAGITASVAHALHGTALEVAATCVGLLVPTDGLWRGAVFHLTPVAMLVAQDSMPNGGVNPFGATDPPTPAFLLWSALWIAGVFALSIASLRNRDI